jgi:hypothetical protein
MKRNGFFLASAGAALLAGCVTLIAPYDAKIDDMATSLQRKIRTEIETLAASSKPDCLYQNHVSFYRDVRVDLSALSVRAAAHAQNELTIGQVTEATGALADLEALDVKKAARGECIGPDELQPIGRAFDSMTGAIVKLEMAKKRGKS